MGIQNIQTSQPGLVGTLPTPIYINTNDTFATVTATGYLNEAKQNGYAFSNEQMALVYTTDEGPLWLKVSISGSDYSLVQPGGSGEVTLPTIANHLIVSTDTAGTLANLTGTAINNGDIQAGIDGTPGSLISYPSTANKGRLSLVAVANTGNYVTTISNAAMGQSSTITIPNPGAGTADFILSDSTTSPQLINTRLTVSGGDFTNSGGDIYAGSSGTEGGFYSHPATASNGYLYIYANDNSAGNFGTQITTAASVGQDQELSIPDCGTTASEFILADTAATTQTISSKLQVTEGTVISGETSGTQGSFVCYSDTAASGILEIYATANAGEFVVGLTNDSHAQTSEYFIPDGGRLENYLAVSQSAAATNDIAFTKVVTIAYSDLASAATFTIVPVPTIASVASTTCQFAILDIKVLNSTGLSGGGGDRLLSITDGTIVFNGSGITAALLGTPICTVWGGTGNPIASGASQVSTAGAAIVAQYTGGTTDYTAGSVQLALTFVQVTQ